MPGIGVMTFAPFLSNTLDQRVNLKPGFLGGDLPETIRLKSKAAPRLVLSRPIRDRFGYRGFAPPLASFGADASIAA